MNAKVIFGETRTIKRTIYNGNLGRISHQSAGANSHCDIYHRHRDLYCTLLRYIVVK